MDTIKKINELGEYRIDVAQLKKINGGDAPPSEPGHPGPRGMWQSIIAGLTSWSLADLWLSFNN